MKREKKSVFLILLILLDYCLAIPSFPSSLNHLEEVALLSNKIDDVLSSMELPDKIRKNVDCQQNDDERFYEQIKDVPLAAEFYDLSTALLFRKNGCKEESNKRLYELLTTVNIDLIYGILDELKSLSNYITPTEILTKAIRPEIKNNSKQVLHDVRTTWDALRNISTRVHLIDGMNHHDIGETVILQCTWTESVCANYVPILSIEQVSLTYSKHMCERKAAQCKGIVIETVGNFSRYILISTCLTVASQPMTTNVVLWSNNCTHITNERLSHLFDNDGKLHFQRHRLQRSIQEDTSVTAYEHHLFKGRHKVFPSIVDYVGQSWNDIISSVKCTGSCTVIAFEHKNYQGRQLSYVNGTNFVGEPMNDMISSIVAIPYDIRMLCYTVYEHDYYKGRSKRFCGDQDYLFTNFYNKISSIKLECDTCSLILYDRKFLGKFKAINGDTKYVGSDYNDVIRSIQVRPWKYDNYEGTIPPKTVLFVDSNFKGKTMALHGVLSWVGKAMNDKVSSIKCAEPCSIVLFKDRDFKGDVIMYQDSQYRLLEFNDKLSSVLVVHEHICVTVYENAHFAGKSKKICADSSYIGNSWNDKISSLKVNCKYCAVIVYKHAKYLGNYKSFMGEISYVGKGWNDIISSIQIRPWKIENLEVKSVQNKKQSCIDEGEKKVHDVIQYIPIISMFYNLGTAIYYSAKNCKDVANERAIGMALDVVMDIATVATGGAAAPIAFGIKTGVKIGAKAGIKAAMIATKVALKASIKKVVSRGVLGNIKHGVKSGIKSVKNLHKSIKSIPGSIRKGVKGIKNIQKNGLKVKNIASNIKKSVKTTFDDLAESASKKIDDSVEAGAKKLDDTVGSAVKKTDDNIDILCRVRRTLLGRKCTKLIQEVSRKLRKYPDFKTFDTNGDGKIFMYRKMSGIEKDVTLTARKLQPNYNKPNSGEVWMSTSSLHSKKFNNKIVPKGTKEYIVEFDVDVNILDKNLKGLKTAQEGSSKINRNLPLSERKNILNTELIKNHHLDKYNIGFKGEVNVDRFNKAVKGLEVYEFKGDRYVKVNSDVELRSDK